MDHKDNIDSLKRVEGQIRGIIKMIEEGRYCVDIMTQISAVKAALTRVEDRVLKRHLDGCVTNAMKKGGKDRQDKMNEIFGLLQKFRKIG
jgi:DNA-binding FrmR family transcriptional regulator